MLVGGAQVIKSDWMYIIVLHEHERGKSREHERGKQIMTGARNHDRGKES